MKNKYKHLFEPIEIGGISVKNRICHVPTDIGASYMTGESSERDVYHHSQIAKGGAGLICVGATTPEMETGKSTVNCTAADNDAQIPALNRLADGIQHYGAVVGIQLEHPGRQGAMPRYPVYSASDMVMRMPWSQSHEILYENEEAKGKAAHQMTTEEIIDLVGKFSDAAWRCKAAGFDFIGLHAAHGYLISQFMSPYLNRRTDRYGGSLENRMRFVLEIISSIQRKCGHDFPLIVRYSADEWVAGGRELKESVEVAQILQASGVAALDISQCIQESPGAGFDPMYYPEGWTNYAAEAIKNVVDVPVIISHSLRNPSYCDKIIADGITDMVGLSRQLLADPFWPVKAMYGKDSDIRRCISCLTGCWQESHMAKRQVTCAINPAVGNESFTKVTKADKPCRIGIVGGGPAGLEAARHAAIRGHDVTLFEKTGELGGAILGDCLCPGKEKMKWYADWIREQVKKQDNIRVIINHAPEVDELRDFDIVANATGASSYVPDTPSGTEDILRFEDVLACPKVKCEYNPGGRKGAKTGESVLIWGDHYQAADTAQFLASIGKRVTIVTEQPEFASRVETIHMYVARKRFNLEEAEALESKPYKYAVKVLENTTVIGVKPGKVTIQDNCFNMLTLDIDTVITCHVRSNTDFMKKAEEAGIIMVNLGDAVSPRNLHAAVMDGATFGKNVDGDAFINPNNAPINDLPLDVLEQLVR